MREFLETIRQSPKNVQISVVALWLLGSGVIAASLASIVFIFMIQTKGKVASEVLDGEAFVKKREQEARSIMAKAFSYELKNVGVQLMSQNGARMAYAQFSLVMDCPNTRCQNMMESSRSRLLDIIFEVANDHSLEDFDGASGILLFKRNLLAKIREKFDDLAPQNVDVTEWIVH